MAKNLDIKSNVATPIESKSHLSSEEKQGAKEKLEAFKKEEMKLVKGLFQNFETPGGTLQLQVKKYKDHFFNKSLEDGKEYEVPLYVARHLNGIDVTATAIDGKIGTCSYPVHSHIMDINGNPMVSVEKRKKRFGFQSLEFAASMG